MWLFAICLGRSQAVPLVELVEVNVAAVGRRRQAARSGSRVAVWEVVRLHGVSLCKSPGCPDFTPYKASFVRPCPPRLPL